MKYSLHNMPKFISKIKNTEVENTQFCIVLFIISDLVEMHGHRFEIHTQVSRIHQNVTYQ